MKGRPRSTPADFWRRVQVGAEDECWPWLGYRTARGYGLLKFWHLTHDRLRPLSAHQVAYHLSSGKSWPLAKGMALHHTCENRLCCNPAHLRLLTLSEHSHVHNGFGCAKHGLSDWAIYNGNGKCRACDRERKRARRRDPVVNAALNARAREKRRLRSGVAEAPPAAVVAEPLSA